VTLRETVFVEEDSVIADALDRKEIQSDDMDSIVPKLKCLAPCVPHSLHSSPQIDFRWLTAR
jgi:hypothetical protein